ncbi:MAG: hypothetical protein DRH17_09095 [Deltaproteobacteria bacterium]|nr:MAG: hypothetical protein DRH17_09095 [Deltaproteobacteria bacterium]
MSRLVFLNALPLNAFPIEEGEEVLFKVVKEPLYSVKMLVKDWARAGIPIECYIRHPTTVELLNNLLNLNLKPSSELYSYREGDKIIVITLKKPVRGKEVEVGSEDIEFYIITVEKEG